jgi:signal transduction histidine kinase
VSTALDRPPNPKALKRARKSANHRIAFYGHAMVWFAVILFLTAVAGPGPATIVALAWAIGLACHGYFGVLAPRLREQLIAEELKGHLQETRRALKDEHLRSVAELSASIAHEVRNPITAAKSLVQQMAEDPRSDDNVEYARIALEELERVEQSVSHLLRFAKEQNVQVADVALDAVVEEALDLLADRTDAVTVVRRLDAAGTLRGDPEKLRQVVVNLVGNALDAVSDGSDPQIEIETGNDLSGKGSWLRVSDNGPGIPSDVLPRIWSPFFTAKEHGTGLGLAISKKIVEAHGGTLEAESPAGGGTRMTVSFER